MNTVELNVKSREKTGKRFARNLRRAGSVPAVLYGHGMVPVSLEVNIREFNKILNSKSGENSIISLKAEGVTLKETTCLIKEVQHNPISDELQHVDFNVIDLNEEIEVEVPIKVKNELDCKGLKAGGVLDLVHHEITIICNATNIPDAIVVDIKDLEINDVLHAKSVKLPQGVKWLDDMDEEETIIAIHPPRVEEAATPAEDEALPKVIEKGKKPEEEDKK